MKDDLVNTIVIKSPGTNPDVPHKVGSSFTDAELVKLMAFFRVIRLSETTSNVQCLALHKMYKLLEQWHTTSP